MANQPKSRPYPAADAMFIAATGTGTEADPFVPQAAAAGRGVTRMDRSGTTSGGEQTIMAANPARTALSVQNNSASRMRIRSTGPASADNGYVIEPGQLYEAAAHDVPTGAISLWCLATGAAFTAHEVG